MNFDFFYLIYGKPTNRSKTDLEPHTGSSKRICTTRLTENTMTRSRMNGLITGNNVDCIQFPAPAKINTATKPRKIRKTGSQELRSDSDGSIILLIVKIK